MFESLDKGWQLLRLFPKEMLKRISPKVRTPAAAAAGGAVCLPGCAVCCALLLYTRTHHASLPSPPSSSLNSLCTSRLCLSLSFSPPPSCYYFAAAAAALHLVVYCCCCCCCLAGAGRVLHARGGCPHCRRSARGGDGCSSGGAAGARRHQDIRRHRR